MSHNPFLNECAKFDILEHNFSQKTVKKKTLKNPIYLRRRGELLKFSCSFSVT